MATVTDWATELNNFLQEHPTGNLTPFFRYAMTKEGPDDKAVHVAQAMLHDTCYGEGRGRKMGAAKREAAKRALEYFQVNGVPGHQDIQPEDLDS